MKPIVSYAMTKQRDLETARASVGRQQQQFVRCLFESHCSGDHENALGINIYRQNLRATAVQALSISFPTVFQLIGEPLFAYAAEALLLKEPPSQGDWATWGSGFAEVLESLEQLSDYPYIADCARLDFSIHNVEKAADSHFEHTTIDLLARVDLDDLCVVVGEAVLLLESDYPLIDLWNAHHENNKDAHIASFKQKVSQVGFKQYILVYRPRYKAQIRSLTEPEYFWMSRIMHGKSIGHTLDLVDSAMFGLDHWLPLAIEQNLLVKFFHNT